MRAAAAAAVLLGLTGGAGPALAHSGVAGLTGFSAAFVHPLTAMDQVLALATAGLLAGQQGRGALLRGAVGVVGGCLLGLANLLYGPAIAFVWLGGLLLALVAGLWVAAGVAAHSSFVFATAALAGFLVGNDTIPEADRWGAIALAGYGAAAAALLLHLVPALIAAFARPHWARIGVRIAASWIAATALMVLALAVSPFVR